MEKTVPLSTIRKVLGLLMESGDLELDSKDNLLIDGVVCNSGDDLQAISSLWNSLTEEQRKQLSDKKVWAKIRRHAVSELQEERELAEKARRAELVRNSDLGQPGYDYFAIRDYRERRSATEHLRVCTRTGLLELGYPTYKDLCAKYAGEDKDLMKEISSPRIGKIDYHPFTDSGVMVKVNLTKDSKAEEEVIFINLWQRPEYWKDRDTYKPYFPKTLKAFYNHLFDGDQNQLEIFLWALRKKCLGERIENILLFVGKGGIGKSTLGILLSNLCGEENVNIANAEDASRDTFNSEMFDKDFNIFEESGLSAKAVEKFKSATNLRGRARGMYSEARTRVQHAQTWVLANPDTFYLHAQPNERRFFAFRLTETPLDAAFGHDPDFYHKLTDPTETGNFYQWLTKVWQPTGPAKEFGTAIDIRTPDFFKLLFESPQDLSNDMEVTRIILESERPRSIQQLRYPRTDQKVRKSRVWNVINMWKELTGVEIAKIEDGMVQSLVTLDDLIYHHDPFGYREGDIKQRVEMEELLADLVEDLEDEGDENPDELDIFDELGI